jgi:hypothetical protein
MVIFMLTVFWSTDNEEASLFVMLTLPPMMLFPEGGQNGPPSEMKPGPGMVFEIVTLPVIEELQMIASTVFETTSTLPVITFGGPDWTIAKVAAPPWLEMFPFTVTPPNSCKIEPDCASIFPLTTVPELRKHCPSSGTTMFPKVSDCKMLELQTVASALASDAINAPTDVDNAAHIESMSIRCIGNPPCFATCREQE